MRMGEEFQEGRSRYAAIVLLHEMIHQLQYEVVGNAEDSYHGHGTIFRNKSNEIGARLGLGRVRANRKDGKDRDLPNCSQWPHAVQSPEYYLGAYVPTNRDTQKPKSVRVPLDLEKAIPVLRKHFDVGELCRQLHGTPYEEKA